MQGFIWHKFCNVLPESLKTFLTESPYRSTFANTEYQKELLQVGKFLQSLYCLLGLKQTNDTFLEL